MNRYTHRVAALLFGALVATFSGCCFFLPKTKTVASNVHPETQALAPMVSPAVAVTLTPSRVALGQGQVQAFTASSTGTPDQGVAWSLNPSLGSVSPNGVYTAPASVALAETVTVTATSLADRSKTATAMIRLRPAKTAAPQISHHLNVLFDTGKSELKSQSRPEIQKIADFMKSYPSAQADIEGHTDNVGTPEINQVLSQRRADAVRQALIDQFGIAASRLTAKGYGETKPEVTNNTPAGRAQNRRVMVTLSTQAN